MTMTAVPSVAPRGTDDDSRDLRLDRIGLAVAIGIVITTALWRIDATSLWVDEAYSLGAANHLGESLRRTTGTMGLYYSGLAMWAQVSTATWWLRLPSAVAAISTLFVVRAIAKRISGSRLAAIAVVFTALNPMFAWKAIEARAYALETLIAAGCWYAAIRIVSDPPDKVRRWRWALGALALAGIFCHGLFIVQLAAIALVTLAGRRPLRSVLATTATFVPAALAVLALHSSGADEIGTDVPGGIGVLVASTTESLLARPTLAKLLLAQFFVIGAVLVVRSALRLPAGTARFTTLVGPAWAIAPALALGLLRIYDPVFNPRYLAPSVPGIALVLAATVLRADAAIAWPTRRGIGIATVSVAVVMATVLAMTPAYVNDDWRGAAALVAAEASPGDGIVFANTSTKEAVQYRPPFEAAWAEVSSSVTPVAVSPARPIGAVRRFDEPRSPEEIAAAAQSLERLWLIEDRPGGPAGIEWLMSAESIATDFVEVKRWSFEDDVVVVLAQRRP